MLLDLCNSIAAQAFNGLSLDKLIYKVNSRCGPSVRRLALTDKYLLFKNFVSNLTPVTAVVRPLAEHALVCNYSNCIEIHSYPVGLLAHHLRSHIARSPARLF